MCLGQLLSARVARKSGTGLPVLPSDISLISVVHLSQLEVYSGAPQTDVLSWSAIGW